MYIFFKQLIIFIVAFFIISAIIGIELSNSRDLSEYYPAQRWNQFYDQEKESLDLVFLGSSYSYRSFIPAYFDSVLEINSFNLGSSTQTPMTSYFVLKEALRYQKPKLVVMEVCDNTLSITDNYKSGIHNIDFIQSFDVRIELMLSHFNLSQIAEYMIPMYRFNNYKTALFSGRKKKIRHMVDKDVYSKYYNRGYVATFPKSNFEEIKFSNTSQRVDRKWDYEQLEYLNKVSILCKENGIKLICVVHPVNPTIFKNIINYQDLSEKYHSLAEINDIEIIDFNLEPTDIKTQDFYDANHLFHKGALKISAALANRLKKKKYF